MAIDRDDPKVRDRENGWDVTVARQLPELLTRLLDSPIYGLGDGRKLPPAEQRYGVYLFSKGGRPRYVGRVGLTDRSKRAGKAFSSFRTRLRGHVRPRHSEGTYAYPRSCDKPARLSRLEQEIRLLSGENGDVQYPFPSSGGFTMKVNRNGRSETVEVTADGEGFCSQAGALLLSNLCDRLGLTEALSEALAPTRQRRSAHADGEILRDLIVMLVQGGEHLCDLATLRDQPGLFGDVASDATAFRAIERIGAAELEGIRAARKAAREQAFALGAGPAQSILDIDASLLGADSEKEGAAGNYKGGFGFHPMLCYLEGSEGALDGILRPGNAGANTGADQVAAVEAALEQLPPDAMEEEILLRGDSAACVHALVDFCREGDIRFSVGHDLTACVREAIAGVPDDAWVGAISQDGEPVAEHPSRPREAYVCELTEHLDLSAWPAGSRLICRRERAHPGAQL
ncbi:MAG: IS1380 family transposase, partial [Solirubrobacterales bacterium]|nr:IS1380 family transposase [Solirubrobacterales bacterium]